MRLKLGAAVALTVACAVAVPVRALADASVVVAPGETVFRIAVRYGTTVDAIVEANGLASPNRVIAGQRLLVPSPGGAWSEAALAATSGAGSGVAAPATAHVVEAGQTLSRIAAQYGTTASQLARANGLASPDHITVGQRLVVPGAAHTDTDAPLWAPAPAGGAGRSIVIDISSQTLTALQDGVAVESFLVSTGTAWTPTPEGSFSITSRYASQHMVGPGYSLPGVPHVQYFHGSYAIHGAYWHTDFGTPRSHGCVNLTPDAAAWLWSWASIGTPVVVRR